MRRLLCLLLLTVFALDACGRTITASDAPPLPPGVCARTDTLWQMGDTTVTITYWSSGKYCS